MREIFTSGSVGRAPGNRCLYPETDGPHDTLSAFRGIYSCGPQFTGGVRLGQPSNIYQEVQCMAKLAERITVDPEQCGGRPCIRDMRIRVTDVLDLLANGLTAAQVLEELPDLEPEDIQACLRFASQRLNHPVVVA